MWLWATVGMPKSAGSASSGPLKGAFRLLSAPFGLLGRLFVRVS